MLQNGEIGERAAGETDAKQSKFDTQSRIDAPMYATFKGVRSLKHRYDSNYQDGLRKSSSLHDLSSEEKEMSVGLESSRFLSRSGDRLDTLTRASIFSLSKNYGNIQTSDLPVSSAFTMPRSTWTRTGQPVPQAFLTPKKLVSSLSSATSASSGITPRRGSIDERPAGGTKSTSGKHNRERSSSLKDFPTAFGLHRESGSDEVTQSNLSTDETESNETDELKVS